LCGTEIYGDGPACLAAMHAGIVSGKKLSLWVVPGSLRVDFSENQANVVYAIH